MIDTLLPGTGDLLIFMKAQAAFVREEAIALSDQIAAYIEAYDEMNDTVISVPGSYWVDTAVGKVIIIGISATFQVSNASLVDVPTVGVVIPSSTVLAQPNIPGRFIGGGYTSFGGTTVMQPRRGLIESRDNALRKAKTERPTARRHVLSVDEARAAANDGFVTDLVTMLPPLLQRKVLSLLAAPHNFTLTSPQLSPNLLSSAFISYFDVEFSVRPLLVSNQRAANTRFAQTNRFGSDGTMATGMLIAPTLTSFVTTTLQQAAAAASAAFGFGAALVQRKTPAVAANVQGKVDTLQDFLNIQFGPLPASLTLEFDVLFRAQLSVNDGDIASVI